jgi:hypothetical protein
MKRNASLKRILSLTRPHWEGDEARPAVRDALRNVLICGTPALGAEVYALDGEEKVVYHTCKSRACPSCGYRSTLQWQRERWVALPDVPYKGITFTMPDVLWPLFRDNKRLLKALPVLAANILRAWAIGKHGIQVGVIAILHTFNGRLEFNSHVHTMVTAGGLQASGKWVSSVYYDQDWLSEQWRRSVVRLLRAALRAGILQSETTAEELEEMLARQEERWWSIKIQTLGSKEHFLRYAGRYARRPPIAQRRIIRIDETTVTFWTRDKKLKCRVEVQYSPEDFIDAWAQHIPERHQHAIRSFGLFAPRAMRESARAVFITLGQKRRPRPTARPWAISIMHDFGWNPLLDRRGKRMKWVRRLAPKKSS